MTKNIDILIIGSAIALCITLGFILGDLQQTIIIHNITEVIVDDNNIQASHVPMDTTLQSGNIFINNTCGELSLVQSTGSSMQPTFFTGNTLVFQKYILGCVELEEGMIVEYYNHENNGTLKGTITHRVYALYPSYFLVAGDHLGNPTKVQYEDIQSIAVGVLYT